MGGCEGKTWARETEEFPMLEARAGKNLAGAVVICELWSLSVAL
jgi:hypothetical protein